MTASISSILIVGAGEAGIAAAGALREAGFAGRVLVAGEEPHHPYARPPLSKAMLTDAACPLEPIRSADWLAERRIELRLGEHVATVDPVAHTAEIVCGAERETERYDRLLIATGASPRRLAALDPLGELVTYLRNWDEALALRARLAGAGSVAIIGGGVIGLEVASSATRLGCAVTIVEAGGRLMERALAPPESGKLLALHRAAGVDVRLTASLVSVALNGDAAALTLADGSMIEADLVVAGIGVVPNDALARRIGCAVDNGVLVDPSCATSVADVFAAGDVSRFVHPLFEAPIRIEAWQHARRHGAHAARAMLGDAAPYAEIPWFWTDQHGVNVQVAGLPGLADIHVVRGATTLHLKGDRLIGATTFDNGRDIRPATKMIAAGWTGPAAALADPDIPLARIAQAPARQAARRERPMSDEWTAVAETDEISEEQPAVAHVDGAEIAIYKVGAAYFATSNICTHGMARLSDGYLDGFLIECPLHQGLFDVRNGKCAGSPVDVDLVSYDVRLVGGTIEVRARA